MLPPSQDNIRRLMKHSELLRNALFKHFNMLFFPFFNFLGRKRGSYPTAGSHAPVPALTGELYIAVFRVILRCTSPVEGFSPVYIFTDNILFNLTGNLCRRRIK